MPNIGALLKEEISRLSRKQSKSQVEPLRKQVTSQRSEIAALKRELAELRRQLKSIGRDVGRNGGGEASGADAGDESQRRVRYSPASVQLLRKKLGLSAEQFGKLLSVSGQSVYNWEGGKSRPRARQIARIAELRSLGKRKAMAMLEEMSAG